MATLEGDAGAATKRGAFTGSSVRNPFNGREVPVYVADYVLMGYGTGAIMAVPAEDDRDFAFAKVHGLDVVRTVAVPDGFDEAVGGAWTGEGAKVNSGFLDGLEVAEAIAEATSVPGARGERGRHGELPAARLARLAPAVLGLPDPRSSTARRAASSRSPSTSCRSSPPTTSRWTRPGRSPLATNRSLPRDDVPRVRRARRARDRHARHVRRLELVLPALLRAARRRRSRSTSSTRRRGCRSASTSAASSTRSCTCSTRASTCAR